MNEQERQRLAEFLRNEVCGQLDRIRKFELGVEGAPPFSELAASYAVTMIAAVLATQPRRMKTMNLFQMFRSVNSHGREYHAWWDAYRKDGKWHLHFHADWVPSADFSEVPDEEFMALVQSSMESWVRNMQERGGD